MLRNPVKRVFLSYRRSDTDYALLLYEFLKQNFGRDGVFLDTDYIEPGENFVETLERELAACGAFVALIGRGWIESLSRLQEERDFVRIEIASVLIRKLSLIPVLAGGAKMPKPDQVPVELATLPQLSAVEFRVHDDLEALVRAIGKAVPVQKASEARPDPQQRFARNMETICMIPSLISRACQVFRSSPTVNAVIARND